MGKITNDMGLPDAIVEAVRNDDYDAGDGDISTTTLIAPPQIRVLRKKHAGGIVEDASDRIYSLVGQAIHTILERAETSAVTEKRLYMMAKGWVVSGQFDRLMVRDGVLQDYKMCSVYEIIFGIKPDRIAQLNVLAQLCEENGCPIKKIEVVMIFRDWKKSEAKRKSADDYPQKQVAIVPLTLWSESGRLQYISERVELHKAAEAGDIPECTADERWASPDKWAVMKEGRKSALRVLDSEEAAWSWCQDNGHSCTIDTSGGDEEVMKKGISIVLRKGESKRCEDYCDVAPYCAQFRAMKEAESE